MKKKFNDNMTHVFPDENKKDPLSRSESKHGGLSKKNKGEISAKSEKTNNSEEKNVILKKERYSGGNEISFHYNREERLKKLRRYLEDKQDEGKKRRLLGKKKNRVLLILLIDLILIAVVGYFLTKPANIYLKENIGNFQYELNVAGIRGNKVMVGFTMKNWGENQVIFSDPLEIKVQIEDNEGKKLIEEKRYFQPGTVLEKGESASLVFLFNQEDLPSRGRLELFYQGNSPSLFSTDVRF